MELLFEQLDLHLHFVGLDLEVGNLLAEFDLVGGLGEEGEQKEILHQERSQEKGVFFSHGDRLRLWKNRSMKRKFASSVWREGEWWVAQCLEVNVASQGRTEQEALDQLREALELYFEEPRANGVPEVKMIEVEVGAA